jgi:hypothetical protein
MAPFQHPYFLSGFGPESIELIIQRARLSWLLPHPLPPTPASNLCVYGRSYRREMEGEGMGEEPSPKTLR